MEEYQPPETIFDLPNDVQALIGKAMVPLSSKNITRLLLITKLPCEFFKHFPEFELPAHLTMRSAVHSSLRIGPFFTPLTAVERFWTLPNLKLLRHLDLSYMNAIKQVAALIDACAPELVTLRLRHTNGVVKLWQSKTRFPKIQILDLWHFPVPQITMRDEILAFVKNQCGCGLKEFSLHVILPYDSHHRRPRVTLPLHLHEFKSFLTPHLKTLQVLRIPFVEPLKEEFAEFVKPLTAILKLNYPLAYRINTSMRLVSPLEPGTNLQAGFLDFLSSFDTCGENFSIHSLVMTSGDSNRSDMCIFDVLLKLLSTCGSLEPIGKQVTILLTEFLPSRGFKPSPLSYVYWALIYDSRTGYNNTYIGPETLQALNKILSYLVQSGADPTAPCIEESGATPFHLGLAPVLLKTRLERAGIKLPAWISEERLRKLVDKKGRPPLVYHETHSYYSPLQGVFYEDFVDDEGNTFLHYVMANYIFQTESWFTSEALKLVDFFKSVTTKKLEMLSKINEYGVSAQSLALGTSSVPVKILNRLPALPLVRSSYWSNSTVEEPVFGRLILMRHKIQDLESNPAHAALKQIMTSALPSDLNAKVYGPKKNLPFMHAAVEAEAVWIFKTMQEMPEVCKKIDLDAFDYMGRTALHVAVAPRKDSVFSTAELLQIMLSLGVSPVILDKNGWTAAMRVCNNKECLKVIGSFLSDEEKKRQSQLFLEKSKASKEKK